VKRIQDFEPGFILQPIPVFVDDFKLNEEQLKSIEGYDLLLKDNPLALDHEHIDIKNLREKVASDKMTINDFLIEAKKIMNQELLRRKKNTILSENFSKIQREVEAIINLYT
jgi:hypothetical protein